MLVVLVLFYLWRGPMRVKSGYSGINILRFDVLERFVHWLTAVTFVILGITGLNITFGRVLLLPWMGPDAFSAWSEWAKYVHNFLSFGFTLGVLLMFVMWIARNLPTAADVQWLKQGGGMFDKTNSTHAPAHKFNAGQKILFWLIILASAAMIISGFMLLFPFYSGLTVGNMELAEIFHAVVGVLFVALILGHIYLGTVGMEGAFGAMADGNVDLNWAKEHHNLWAKEEMQKVGAGKSGAMRPAE
jgi:formate dehydrogenase subunit gamma